MYKERREKASIRFYVLIFLVILIIIFSIMLLIPKKKQVKKVKPVKMELYSKSDMLAIKKSYSESFYDNLEEVKKAAEKYFLKKVDGLSKGKKITLDQLINDNHFMATLYDAEGNKCDEEQSYISYAKNSIKKQLI